MEGEQTSAWVLKHLDENGLILVSPCGQLVIGPYTSICDVEQALRRLCQVTPDTAAAVTSKPNGRLKVRFSNAVEFTVTTGATRETVTALLHQARHNEVDDQRDARRRRFSISGPIKSFAG